MQELKRKLIKILKTNKECSLRKQIYQPSFFKTPINSKFTYQPHFIKEVLCFYYLHNFYMINALMWSFILSWHQKLLISGIRTLLRMKRFQKPFVYFWQSLTDRIHIWHAWVEILNNHVSHKKSHLQKIKDFFFVKNKLLKNIKRSSSCNEFLKGKNSFDKDF